MRCPTCGHIEDKVVDSREAQDGLATRRRRECLGCGRRFTTYERIEEVIPPVVKKDGRREPFDRRKIAEGVQIACQKRPVSAEQIEALVSSVERTVMESGDREIRTTAVGEAVMERLKALDEVAYVRFASVYRAFRDVDEFMKKNDQLDDEIRRNNISFAYSVFNRFLERMDERVRLVDELVKEPQDFTADEELVIEPDLLNIRGTQLRSATVGASW